MSPWIYFNGQCWQVKCRESDGTVTVLREFPTRGEAYRWCAWGIL